jgi:sterol desaturase/sphingolipid hydroxylase (fatty acid hydroxylase superfamily)
MNLQYSAIVIPIILFFMLIEYLAAVYFGKKDYFKFENSISNLSVGIAERFSYLLFAFVYYKIFQWIYQNFALMEIPSHPLVWIGLLMLTDLLWYWYHRWGHEINLFWSAHIVHHQSEDFNFTVAARITFFQAVIRNFFWCVMPLLGFHPDMVITILLVHGGYSFFTHTRMIGKLGFLEKIFITPSHHRVHHASNERYLDKNYGDIFVFWDKIFGTFQEEDEEPIFGLVKPLESNSFLWQHFHFYFEMYEAISMEKSLKNRFKILMGSPIMVTELHRRRARRRFHQKSVKINLTYFQKGYLVVQSGIALLILYLVTSYYYEMDWVNVLLVSMFLFVTLVNIGAVIEKKNWNYYLEIIRFYIGLVWVYWAVHYDAAVGIFLIALCFGLAFLPVKDYYRKHLIS